MKNNELKTIEKIRTKAAVQGRTAGRLVRLGIGDDATILRPVPKNQELLATTDLVLEGSHFHRDHPPAALGHKVIARGLSDIAAMGGEPFGALLSLAFPGWAEEKWEKQFWDGLFRQARRWGVRLLGGDLAAAGFFAADIVMLGLVPRGRALLRSEAKPGDTIYVSGRLGGAALGLERLLAGGSLKEGAVRRHLVPQPRISLGRFLAARLGVRCAMDISDGLSIDLFRLAKESGAGAEIHAGGIPRFPGASLSHALHGGEDYELLFTAPPHRRVPASFEGIPLTPIGRITAGRRLVLVGDDGKKRPLPIEGFQHQV